MYICPAPFNVCPPLSARRKKNKISSKTPKGRFFRPKYVFLADAIP